VLAPVRRKGRSSNPLSIVDFPPNGGLKAEPRVLRSNGRENKTGTKATRLNVHGSGEISETSRARSLIYAYHHTSTCHDDHTERYNRRNERDSAGPLRGVDSGPLLNYPTFPPLTRKACRAQRLGGGISNRPCYVSKESSKRLAKGGWKAQSSILPARTARTEEWAGSLGHTSRDP